jgi:hypothetical protein
MENISENDSSEEQESVVSEGTKNFMNLAIHSGISNAMC